MPTAQPVASSLYARRVALRRIVALVAALVGASILTTVAGTAYVWPFFVFPLFLAAVFLYEPGSLLVTFWLGNFFVLSYGFGAAFTSARIYEAALGTALFLLAGLLLGRNQRRHRDTQRELAASTLTDRLTGLYNYGSFVDHLHREVTNVDRYGGEISLIMLDLDHFKQFNDQYGHEAGNDLLGKVGTALDVHLRDADIAARYGGEEFAVLIRGDEVHGLSWPQRLRRAVEDIAVTVRGVSQIASATISAGIATYPTGGRRGRAHGAADDALYESKRRGRNRVTIFTGVTGERGPRPERAAGRRPSAPERHRGQARVGAREALPAEEFHAVAREQVLVLGVPHAGRDELGADAIAEAHEELHHVDGVDRPRGSSGARGRGTGSRGEPRRSTRVW